MSTNYQRSYPMTTDRRMRIIKAPRATVTVCPYALLAMIGAAVVLPAIVLSIVAVWTDDGRWLLTAMFAGIPAAIVGAASAVGHSEHVPGDDRKNITIPLPWRSTPEDNR